MKPLRRNAPVSQRVDIPARLPIERRRRLRLTWLLLLLIGGLVQVPAVGAQVADLTHWTSGYSEINQSWRFHAGDNPQWALAGFDDAHWSLLDLDKSWAQQGYAGYSGYAWYRIRLRLPASETPLALLLYPPANSAEVFVDGRLVATVGQMRPAPLLRIRFPLPVRIALPHGSGGGSCELALRVWESSLFASSSGAGRTALPLAGSQDAIRELHLLAFDRFAIQQLPSMVPLVISAVTALFSFALFLVGYRAREYLWGTLWLLGGPLELAADLLRQYQQWPLPVSVLVLDIIQALGLAFWLLFIWRFVGSGEDWKLKFGLAQVALLPIGDVLVMMGAMPVAGDYLLSTAVTLSLGILLFVHLLRLAIRGNHDAQIFLAPFLLYTGQGVIDGLRGALFFLGIVRVYNPHSDSLALYHSAALTVTGSQFFSLLAYLAVAVVLVLRFARSAREEQRLTTELQSARQVQARLVPAALASTPHLRFDAAYCAASEVGGDFYQVFSGQDGSALITIGDVSGKGLNAAMFATLVVGALRSMARQEMSPSQILSCLNQELIDPDGTRLVTCLVLRISLDGRICMANAGHLPPYWNGREMEIESGLPLGVWLASDYADTQVELAPGDTLTLLSDGIAEAQDAKGELFGFERTAAISTRPAAEIARAAQAFGQQDDITVLRIDFAPVPVLETRLPPADGAPRRTRALPQAAKPALP
ncbi:MAG TPA: SpoIIE family protein phosphatase [Acidobacteriaceae bacterium]|nr:SpoIIE family protein phosphatase [Acidobacteriaceae bacterium]